MVKLFYTSSMIIIIIMCGWIRLDAEAHNMIRRSVDQHDNPSNDHDRNAMMMMGDGDGSDWGDHNGMMGDNETGWGAGMGGGNGTGSWWGGGGMMGGEGTDWGGGDGGMMGGAGPGWGGDGGICGGAMLGLWGQSEASYYKNLSCLPTSTSATTEPACLPAPGGHHFEDHGFHHNYDGSDASGTWVCRTLYNPVTGEKSTFSACIDSEYALTSDTCGCCGGTCPESCTCACDLITATTTSTGVLVLVPSRQSTTATFEVCVGPERAVSMVAHGPAVCKTECT